MINFGNTIRTYRKKKDLTQVELALRLGIEPTYLSAIENGRRDPSLTLVRQIGKAISVPPEILFWDAIQTEDVVSEKDRRVVDAAKSIIRQYF